MLTLNVGLSNQLGNLVHKAATVMVYNTFSMMIKKKMKHIKTYVWDFSNQALSGGQQWVKPLTIKNYALRLRDSEGLSNKNFIM